MLPWLIGVAALAVGKLVYDKLSDDDYDDESSSSTQERQREKEHENKQIKYEKIVEEYKTKLKNCYEAECICEEPQNKHLGSFSTYAYALGSTLKPTFSLLEFKRSKKLDAIQKDIKNLKKDMDVLWKINVYAKSLIKE